MSYVTKEDSSGTGTLANSAVSTPVKYRLRIVVRVEHKPGFGAFEHIPKLQLTFSEGTGGISGPATFTTNDGRRVTCELDGDQVAITGSLG